MTSSAGLSRVPRTPAAAGQRRGGQGRREPAADPAGLAAAEAERQRSLAAEQQRKAAEAAAEARRNVRS